MRSRKSLFVLGLFVLGLAAISLVGCGDDEKGTSTNPNLLSGDDYVATTAHVNSSVDSTLTVIANGLASLMTNVSEDDDVVAQMPGIFYGPGFPGDGSFADNWMVVTATSLTASGTVYYLDSLQFLINGTPQSTSVNADQMVVKHLWRVTNDDTTTTYVDYEADGGLLFENLDGQAATITGDVSLEVDSKEVGTSTTWETWDIQVDITSLTVNRVNNQWTGSCPVAGDLTATVTLTTQVGDAQPVVTEYEYTMTIENGSASVSAVSGTKSATYNVDFCTVPTM